MNPKIDVLAVLDSLIEYHDAEDSLKGRNCIAARAAVAELIEAIEAERWARTEDVPTLTLVNAVWRTDAALARLQGGAK